MTRAKPNANARMLPPSPGYGGRSRPDKRLGVPSLSPGLRPATLVWGLTADHLHSSGNVVRVVHAGLNLA